MFARAEKGAITRKTDDLKLEAEMPARLRLQRERDTFTTYTSEDGERWTQVGDAVTIDRRGLGQARLERNHDITASAMMRRPISSRLWGG